MKTDIVVWNRNFTKTNITHTHNTSLHLIYKLTPEYLGQVKFSKKKIQLSNLINGFFFKKTKKNDRCSTRTSRISTLYLVRGRQLYWRVKCKRTWILVQCHLIQFALIVLVIEMHHSPLVRSSRPCTNPSA